MDISSKIAGIAKRLPANVVLSSDFEFLVRCVPETRSIGGLAVQLTPRALPATCSSVRSGRRSRKRRRTTLCGR